MYGAIARNKRRTIFLMLLFIGFVGAIGWIFAGYTGNPAITPYVLIGAVIYALFSYFMGSRWALAVNGAQLIDKRDNPRLYRIVENLAITEGLPTPQIYIMIEAAPNAFATGRDPAHSSIAVTRGLLEIMDDQELEGVIAHELGHVKNYDIRIAMIAFALVAVVSLFADIMLRMTWFRDSDDNEGGQIFFILGIVAAILAPVVAGLIQLAVSRQREYLADATSALTTRYPEGLERALQKIGQYGGTMKRQNASTAHLFFANPLKGHSLASLFSTHPPIEDRIAKLKAMETRA